MQDEEVKVIFYTLPLDDTVVIQYVSGKNEQVVYETPRIPMRGRDETVHKGKVTHMSNNEFKGREDMNLRVD